MEFRLIDYLHSETITTNNFLNIIKLELFLVFRAKRLPHFLQFGIIKHDEDVAIKYKNNNQGKTMKRSILLSCLFIVISINQNLYATQNSNPERWIIVFVHGIVGIDAKTCFTNLFQFITDQLVHTTYAKSVGYMRADDFFTQNQAMQGLGLVPIDINNYQKGYACAAIARSYDFILSKSTIKRTCDYYTFGWSGLLSFKARYNDAKSLYTELATLGNTVREHGLNPKIALLGYSHGANVCLNLGQVYKEEPFSSMPLKIDELILVGAPIQRETEKLVASPIFKKIYSFYSRSDHVQKKDLFSSQQIFSNRVFRNHREFKLPPTLTQIEVKISKESLPRKRKHAKTTNNTGVLTKATDLTKRSIIKGRSYRLRNMSPGHTELWFMAWTPRNYRDNFPLYPVPIATLTPYLIQLVEKTLPTQTSSRHVIVDIRPDHNYMVIRQRFPQRQYSTVSFLTKETFDNLATISLPNKPDYYTKEEHNNHRNQAWAQAHAEQKEKIHLKRTMRHNKNKAAH